jgi:FtsZ-interacting cell division protein YlmF
LPISYTFKKLNNLRYIPMFQKRRTKRIGQVLLEAEAITEEQLNSALKRQRKNGRSLGRNLVELGYIDEDEIAQCLAEEYKIPYVSLDRYKFDKNLADIIPEDISRNHELIPLDLIGDILTVGIVDVPPDERVIRRLEELTGFKIQIMLVDACDFNHYMQMLYDFSIFNRDEEVYQETEVGSYIKTPLYEGKERRRFPRFNKKLTVKYDFKNEYNINSSINISQGGVLIKSKSPVPVNSHLIIRLKLPTSYKDIIIISKVVRVERIKDKNVYLIALNFRSMDARDSKRLAEFIRSIK